MIPAGSGGGVRTTVHEESPAGSVRQPRPDATLAAGTDAETPPSAPERTDSGTDNTGYAVPTAWLAGWARVHGWA